MAESASQRSSGTSEPVGLEPTKRRLRRDVAIPALFGVIAFFVVTGGRMLSPRNIAWLSKGDPATYFIGWHFFRNTPWGFPIGVNPRYGAELSTSLAFADNVALFAFPFKAITRWLPSTFQYFGIWTLCCFVLQAWFAWLLVGLITKVPLARACGMGFFVLAPPFLWRLQGHYQMEGQWLVLASLYVCFGPRRLARGPSWPILAFTVSLVHSYITAMVLGLWLTDWLRRVLFERRTRSDLVQLVIVPVLVLVGFWQVGLFLVGNGVTKAGFGQYRMNVLSLVDPSGWSYLLKDIPEGTGDYEGFNYLGLGGILLALLAVPALKGAWLGLRHRRQYWPLLVFLLGLGLFAISNRIGFANRNLVIPLPKAWIDRANLLRANGRMFWPVFYVLLWVLIRTLFAQHPPRRAGIILLVLFVIQAVDLSAGWRPIRRDLMIAGGSWDSPLKAPFWSQVPAMYQEIRVVPPRNQPPNYATFAYFAATHGMTTDAVYFARIDQEKLLRARDEALLAVNHAKYAAGSLYIVDRRYERAARRSMNPDRDTLDWIDGFLVLAPGWKCRAECATGATTDHCSANCPKN